MDSQTILKESGKQNSSVPVHEGSMTRSIRHKAEKIPSTYFLTAAGGALALSVGLAVMREEKGWANFVGNWVPTLLMLGIYNKIVKTHDSDPNESANRLH